VQVGEQQPRALVGGASALAGLFGTTGQRLLVHAATHIESGTRGAGAVLVGTQQRLEQDRGSGLGKSAVAQRGQCIGDAIGGREQRAGDVFERAKRPLDGALATRVPSRCGACSAPRSSSAFRVCSAMYGVPRGRPREPRLADHVLPDAGVEVSRTFNVGLAGYALWQVTDDTGSDVPPALLGAHDRAFGLGPELDITIAPIRSRVTVRYEHDLAVQSRTLEQIFLVSFNFGAYRPSSP
jgi:hypothetical protein